MERNNIEKFDRREKLTDSMVHSIIKNDTKDNWDIEEAYDLKDAIDIVDGWFGIN